MTAMQGYGRFLLPFLAVTFDHMLWPSRLLIQWHHGEHQFLRALIYDGALFMSLPVKRLAA